MSSWQILLSRNRHCIISCMGFIINNHPTLRAEPEDKDGCCEFTNLYMHYVLYLQPDWSLLSLVLVAYRKHHSLVYETELTTSCQYMVNLLL